MKPRIAKHQFLQLKPFIKAAHLEEHDGDATGLEKLVAQTLIKLWNVHSRLHADAEGLSK